MDRFGAHPAVKRFLETLGRPICQHHGCGKAIQAADGFFCTDHYRERFGDDGDEAPKGAEGGE